MSQTDESIINHKNSLCLITALDTEAQSESMNTIQTSSNVKSEEEMWHQQNVRGPNTDPERLHRLTQSFCPAAFCHPLMCESSLSYTFCL